MSVWRKAGGLLRQLSFGAQASVVAVGTYCLPPPLPSAIEPPSEVPIPAIQVLGSGRKGAGSAGGLSTRFILLEPGGPPRRGPTIPAQDPDPAQSRHLPERCFWRPGGRSSSPGRRGEAQACLFLCSESRESLTHCRWPSSRASQPRGRTPRGSLVARGFSAFRGLSSLRGLSFWRLSLRGLSFCCLSLGPRWARGEHSFPVASPSSFSTASTLPGTSVFFPAFTWGTGDPDGGTKATGVGCNAAV